MQKIELDDYIVEYEISYRGKKYIKAKFKDGKLIVTAPPRTQKYYIEKLLKANSKKIIKTLFPEVVETPEELGETEETKKEKKVKEKPSKPIVEKEPDYVHLNDKQYVLSYVLGHENACYFNQVDVILVAKKNDKKLYRKNLYQYYKQVVEQEVRKLLPQVYKDFAEIKMPVINVKDYKSNRLGICRKVNDTYVVSLSAKLAKYDLKYIKVVLYHELSHIFEMNHSKAFYDVFESKYKDAKKAQKALKAIKYRDCI